MTLQEINQNIAANLDRICLEKGMDKAEFIKDLITHFSDVNYPKISKETIYQMVNGGRKRNECKDLSPVSFGIEKLHAVSEYLGISIDGFISNDKPLTNNPEIQAICEYTGLNESSVTELREYFERASHSPEDNIIDSVLRNKMMNDFITLLSKKFLFYLEVYYFESYNESVAIRAFDFKIEQMLKTIKEKDHKYNWFLEHKDDLYEWEEKVNNSIKIRRCSLLDIQDITTFYVKKVSCTDEYSTFEENIAKKMSAYYKLFIEKLNIAKKESGDNHGEYNQND